MYNCPIFKRFTLLSLTWAVGLFFTTIGCVVQWQTPASNEEVSNLQTKETARPVTLIRTIIGYVKHGLKRTTSRLLRTLDAGGKRCRMQPQVLPMGSTGRNGGYQALNTPFNRVFSSCIYAGSR